MVKKKYEVPGMMEWHPEFKVGRSSLQIAFTGGHLCCGGSTPASFETADPVIQRVIESSEAFFDGRIRLRKVSKSDDMVKATNQEVFEYSDIKEVYEFLQHIKGVPVDDLSEKDSCFLVAKRLGVKLRKKND